MIRMISLGLGSRYYPKRRKLYISRILMHLISLLPHLLDSNQSLMEIATENKIHSFLLYKFCMLTGPVSL